MQYPQTVFEMIMCRDSCVAFNAASNIKVFKQIHTERKTHDTIDTRFKSVGLLPSRLKGAAYI